MDQRTWKARYDAALSRHLLDRAGLGLDQAGPLTRGQRAWLANGRKPVDAPRPRARDVPRPRHPGHARDRRRSRLDSPGSDRTTQDSGQLLQTGYHHDGRARLWIVDAATGGLTGTVGLGPDARGAPPRHLGGIAVRDETVFVTSAEKPPRLFAYDRSALLSGRTA